MNTLSLNVDELRVTSFETEEPEMEAAESNTGSICATRPTLYTCCTN